MLVYLMSSHFVFCLKQLESGNHSSQSCSMIAQVIAPRKRYRKRLRSAYHSWCNEMTIWPIARAACVTAMPLATTPSTSAIGVQMPSPRYDWMGSCRGGFPFALPKGMTPIKAGLGVVVVIGSRYSLGLRRSPNRSSRVEEKAAVRDENWYMNETRRARVRVTT